MARKDQSLPGMERTTNKEVSDAAERYVDARDKRIKMLAKEVELKDVLSEKMHKHGFTTYRDDDLVVEIVPGKEKLKVSPANEDGAD